MKKIAILGSTGSIGTQTLDIVRENKKKENYEIEVVALSAGSNVELLAKQIIEFKPSMAVIGDQKDLPRLRSLIGDQKITLLYGMEGLIALATHPDSEILVTAIVGMIGIRPTIEAMKAGKDIALANKETLVTAGHIIMPLAKKTGVSILPVDSEHSAIFQVLHGENSARLHKLLITASGGPFRGKSREELQHVTVEDTLKHPNWAMGRKITVDSATLVNKGLEVLEAHWLFDVDFEHIDVVVQPQSIIHSMVEYVDGAVVAQMGTPDMRLPIQYALYYPDRTYLPGDRLDFKQLRNITFEQPDTDVFKGLPLAIKAGLEGGSMPVVFNAANEYAVALFLEKRIGFLDIYRMIEMAMEAHNNIAKPSLEEILETEQWVYQYIESRWNFE